MIENLEIGFALKDRWHLIKGTPVEYTRDDLIALARILAAAGTPYAVIGGVALEIYSDDPRATKDIDLAVESYETLPRQELSDAGFKLEGRFPDTENWRAPGGTPVQFSDDVAFRDMIHRANERSLGPVLLRILTKPDLVRTKLISATEPRRRKTKQKQDKLDVEKLLDADPSLGD